jgi:hypothetical protein
VAAATAAAAATGSGDLEDEGRTLLHCVCMQGTVLPSPASTSRQIMSLSTL